ncbi:MAG: ABC transporter permease [Tissierellia bacterium]|nr:ABC transporter permease [Tissierellia bacterium]
MSLGIVPEFLLPSPGAVFRALVGDGPLLFSHSIISVQEALLGLLLGSLLGVALAMTMEYLPLVRKMFYPLMIVSQTIPTVAVAPLLVLWFGYGIEAKVVLIILMTFFPIAMGILDGFDSVDDDQIRLLKTMGAGPGQILWYVKLPQVVPHFFAGLKISAAYAIVGAVIAEWLGGSGGLGVYMTRVRKSFAFDRMFAVLFVISALSLLLLKGVDLLHRMATPWRRDETRPKGPTSL